ncbi:hypothetical protein D3C75_1383390 [compost metagenome]
MCVVARSSAYDVLTNSVYLESLRYDWSHGASHVVRLDKDDILHLEVQASDNESIG